MPHNLVVMLHQAGGQVEQGFGPKMQNRFSFLVFINIPTRVEKAYVEKREARVKTVNRPAGEQVGEQGKNTLKYIREVEIMRHRWHS